MSSKVRVWYVNQTFFSFLLILAESITQYSTYYIYSPWTYLKCQRKFHRGQDRALGSILAMNTALKHQREKKSMNFIFCLPIPFTKHGKKEVQRWFHAERCSLGIKKWVCTRGHGNKNWERRRERPGRYMSSSTESRKIIGVDRKRA